MFAPALDGGRLGSVRGAALPHSVLEPSRHLPHASFLQADRRPGRRVRQGGAGDAGRQPAGKGDRAERSREKGERRHVQAAIHHSWSHADKANGVAAVPRRTVAGGPGVADLARGANGVGSRAHRLWGPASKEAGTRLRRAGGFPNAPRERMTRQNVNTRCLAAPALGASAGEVDPPGTPPGLELESGELPPSSASAPKVRPIR